MGVGVSIYYEKGSRDWPIGGKEQIGARYWLWWSPKEQSQLQEKVI